MFGTRNSDESTSESWEGSRKEWQLIEKAVMANSAELKRQRRWGIFFKLLTFVYLFALLWLFIAGRNFGIDAVPEKTGGHTAVVDIRGIIAAGELANADAIISSIKRALDHEDTKALVLRINSPGGSPVQSAYVYEEIRRQRELNPQVPIHAVIVDTGASGAYYMAAGAENIYANGASIVGSIGVTASGFGFHELIDRLGIERRELTSGRYKNLLDPFQELEEEEEALFEEMLNDVHEQFIEDVKAGRGDRLEEDYDLLFSGLFWTGRQALELGLIDGLKSTSELARDLGYPQLVDFTVRMSPLERFAREFGASIAETLVKLGATESLELR